MTITHRFFLSQANAPADKPCKLRGHGMDSASYIGLFMHATEYECIHKHRGLDPNCTYWLFQSNVGWCHTARAEPVPVIVPRTPHSVGMRSTNRCVNEGNIPELMKSCMRRSMGFRGPASFMKTWQNSPMDCEKLCQKSVDCKFWDYFTAEWHCNLYKDYGTFFRSYWHLSGTRTC